MQHALYKAHTKQSLIYIPAPPPASHAVTTQTLELVTPPLTQHGREVKSPPTAHITVSSDLLLKLREEIEVLKSEVKDLKEEVARLKAAPPPVATPPPQVNTKYGTRNQIELRVPLTHKVHQPTRMIMPT